MLAPIGKRSLTKRDALQKRQPVQITKQWRDVVVLTTRADQSCSSIEHRLKLVKYQIWKTGWCSATVVQSGKHHGDDKGMIGDGVGVRVRVMVGLGLVLKLGSGLVLGLRVRVTVGVKVRVRVCVRVRVGVRVGLGLGLVLKLGLGLVLVLG